MFPTIDWAPTLGELELLQLLLIRFMSNSILPPNDK